MTRNKKSQSVKRHLPHHKGQTIVDGVLFRALVASDFKCSYCQRSLPSHKASLASNGVTCGCNSSSEFVKNKGVTKIPSAPPVYHRPKEERLAEANRLRRLPSLYIASGSPASARGKRGVMPDRGIGFNGESKADPGPKPQVSSRFPLTSTK